VKWFRRSVEDGDAAGATGLGYAYASGQGVKRDYRQAAAWFLKAAEDGETLAQYNLGLLYERGLGVGLDYVEAYKWHAVAAARGRGESREALKALAQVMTPAQLERGRDRVTAWEKTHTGVEETSVAEVMSALGNDGLAK
jgi:TPR repeat protein